MAALVALAVVVGAPSGSTAKVDPLSAMLYQVHRIVQEKLPRPVAAVAAA